MDYDFALTHVPATRRVPIAALWALDETLGRVVATTREPLVGQLRLTWWHEALSTLGRGEPVLDALAEHVVPLGIEPATLAAMVEGWEVLLAPMPFDEATLIAYADARGVKLFALTAAVLGCTLDAQAGGGWALVDFARRCSDPVTASRAFLLARPRLSNLGRLPRPLRILARLAVADARAGKWTARTRWRLLRASF